MRDLHVECEEWVWDRDGKGAPSIFQVIRSAADLEKKKTRPIYECRYDERLKTKTEESTHLTYTGFLGELEHLKLETRLIDEMFASVMCEHVFLKDRRPINI